MRSGVGVAHRHESGHEAPAGDGESGRLHANKVSEGVGGPRGPWGCEMRADNGPKGVGWRWRMDAGGCWWVLVGVAQVRAGGGRQATPSAAAAWSSLAG